MPAENKLVARLPRKDRTRFLSACEPFQLTLGDVLSEAGLPTRHVYFPTKGFISLLTRLEGEPVLEVGMVGREGMLGAQIALGVNTAPLHSVVQGEGTAWRISTAAFRRELAQNAALQSGLNRYFYVLMAQLASSAGCLRFHLIENRLARWLLMSQDRIEGDKFDVTHEFLAHMLGVRRVGVTAAAGVLQRKGLIEYHRGHLTVLDRKGLERAACTCYAQDRRAYAALLD